MKMGENIPPLLYEHAPFLFDEVLLNKLERFSEQNGSTFFHTLLAGFRLLSYRYNKRDDIYVRNLDNSEQILGEVSGQMSFQQLLDMCKKAASDNTNPAQFRDNRISVKLSFSMHYTTEEFLFSSNIDNPTNTSDLAFIIDGTAEQGLIQYNPREYSAHTVERMIVHYKQLLYSAIREPLQKIGLLYMLTPLEEHELIDAFNDTFKHIPQEKTLVNIFEEQVARVPDNVALRMYQHTMTYGEANKKANQLARHLISEGVRSGDMVGLIASRGFDMIVALYAILKTGAAYVPVDPDYPKERQLNILRLASVKIAVTSLEEPVKDVHARTRFITMSSVGYSDYDDGNLNIFINSKQLAYTIFTSGSTGTPKGVMIEHHSAVNLITWVNTTFSITEHDRLLFITSICFDLSVYDIFGMLASGGSIVIADKNDITNMGRLVDMLHEFQVTFWDSVPTTMDTLVNRINASYDNFSLSSLRLVFLSGDLIPTSLPDRAKRHFSNAEIISLGGATEGTVWSNYFPVKDIDNNWRSIPYGKPITNNSFYILNEELQPVPYGVIGELYIGGLGVARGYINDPQRTSNSFLRDPFTTKWGSRMYRTGDLGRMLPDRNIEFIGRADNQVKVRGHRIELSEIEHMIRQCKTVENVVVLFYKEKMQIVCFAVPGQYYDRDTLLVHLRAQLPHYMIPERWVELERIPLTPNGKTDTKALINLDTKEHLKNSFVAPRNEREKAIATVWQRVLNINEVSINDNFFDLGGQSLLAVELTSEIEKNIGKPLPVNVLYKHATIAELSAFLEREGELKQWKSLIPLKQSGEKTPMYIVHGDGLSLSNFHNLAELVHPEQPIFSLQPIGLDGLDKPLECISAIAHHYISEIMEHNPNGPYVLGGYSFGGYVAIEMKKQLELMEKTVKMLAIFDTNAENVHYQKTWTKTLPSRVFRQLPKFLFITKSIISNPLSTIQYQYSFFSKKVLDICCKLGIKEKPQPEGINKIVSQIDAAHLRAFRKYNLTPFNDKIHLFKAKSRRYFVDDFKYLGWTRFAQKGVEVYEVPGDHTTMFESPNVNELARLLQNVLDNC